MPFLNALLNMPIVPENKAPFVLFVYCVFVMCIFVLIFNNKDFIFAHFGLNIHHTFLYFVTWNHSYFIFCYLKGFVFIKGKLFWLHCSDKIVKPTWQWIMIKIMINQKKTWYDIFAISPTPTQSRSTLTSNIAFIIEGDSSAIMTRYCVACQWSDTALKRSIGSMHP